MTRKILPDILVAIDYRLNNNLGIATSYFSDLAIAIDTYTGEAHATAQKAIAYLTALSDMGHITPAQSSELVAKINTVMINHAKPMTTLRAPSLDFGTLKRLTDIKPVGTLNDSQVFCRQLLIDHLISLLPSVYNRDKMVLMIDIDTLKSVQADYVILS